jgi:hypothetical protein
LTAADSPPDVHQWITSAFCANAGATKPKLATRLAITVLAMVFI